MTEGRKKRLQLSNKIFINTANIHIQYNKNSEILQAYLLLIMTNKTLVQSGGNPCLKVTDILEDPGAVSRVWRKCATKVFKYGRKSPWVPTLTELFPKLQADAGSWLGTKNALYYCAHYCCFLFSKINSYLSLKIHFINRLVPRLKN